MSGKGSLAGVLAATVIEKYQLFKDMLVKIDQTPGLTEAQKWQKVVETFRPYVKVEDEIQRQSRRS